MAHHAGGEVALVLQSPPLGTGVGARDHDGGGPVGKAHSAHNIQVVVLREFVLRPVDVGSGSRDVAGLWR